MARRPRLLATAVLLLAAVLSGCGSKARAPEPASPGPKPARAVPAPAPQRLALGLSEQNPSLIAPGRVAARFAPWRDRVAALDPSYYRLFVDWSKLDDGRLDTRSDGCLRGLPPCAAYAGVRAQLRALAARRRTSPGRWTPVIVIYGVPKRYAQPAAGCERSDATPDSRPLSADGIAAYQRLIAGILAEGAAAGVPLRWWSPWNEPNHPAFISPQRAACDVASPSLAPAVYAQLARAAKAELARSPAHHDLLLGELAGYTLPTPHTTSISEFVAALPDDVACGATAWSVHQYSRPDGTSPNAVGALEQALDARPCTRGKDVWITETGAGGTKPGADRATTTGSSQPAAACRAEAASLARWDADPRVAAAFQYSFRDDPAYPVGLADVALTRTFPAYDLWREWASAPADGPPPALPASCS